MVALKLRDKLILKILLAIFVNYCFLNFDEDVRFPSLEIQFNDLPGFYSTVKC